MLSADLDEVFALPCDAAAVLEARRARRKMPALCGTMRDWVGSLEARGVRRPYVAEVQGCADGARGLPL